MLYKVKKFSILDVFAVTFYGICIFLYTVCSKAIAISEDTTRLTGQRTLEGYGTDDVAKIISNLNKYFFEKTQQEIDGQN
jgi:hypothetical protein